MKLCHYFAVLILVTTSLVPESAFAARAGKLRSVAAVADGAYHNKPIAPGATVWYCAYGGHIEILCRLGASGDSVARVVQAIDSRLPRIVGDILNNPQRFARGHIRIPLLGQPFDFELVGQLAEAVMCGSNAHCGVVFAESLDKLQILVRSFESTRQVSSLSRLAGNPSLAESGE